ncbi:hypothetical protein HPP92_021158 [Vanilla planifolia]|uniref:Noroxomaritidine/norcraugsodine reductase n=2 Tax=Vanilla planifolia TaxID=51239 RepID=A0A835UI96_VANPL|nr:hypothetical protein HPP92_021158 [Vanilla planifolia]
MSSFDASGYNFPPQKQDRQPGKEHAMDPNPTFLSRDYKPAGKLLGKTALVTGGDSGIGRAVCIHFALEGASVAFTYVELGEKRDAEDTLRLLRQLKSPLAKDPIAIRLDAGYESNCRKCVEEVAVHFGGRIAVLVNNAAEQHVAYELTAITEEQLERTFRTNIFSYFFMTKLAVERMGDGGSIINTASVNAYKGNKKLLDYTATKGAVVAFTRGLALQLVDKGIRVNGVAPGPVWTPLIPASFSEEDVAEFGKQVPMMRAGQPAEIPRSFVFLACGDSSYVTGVIHPNGGTIVNG